MFRLPVLPSIRRSDENKQHQGQLNATLTIIFIYLTNYMVFTAYLKYLYFAELTWLRNEN